MEDFSQFLTHQVREPSTDLQARHNLKCVSEALRRAVAERDLLLATTSGAGVARELWSIKQDMTARGYAEHLEERIEALEKAQSQDATLRHIGVLFQQLSKVCAIHGVKEHMQFQKMRDAIEDTLENLRKDA